MKMNWLFLLLIPVLAWGQITGQRSADRIPGVAGSDAGVATVAEHYPLFYTGTDTVFARRGPVATRWMQFGWWLNANIQSNGLVGKFGPQIFDLVVDLDRYGDGDSVGLSKARFEVAYDTAGTTGQYWGSVGEIQNGDSSNICLKYGNYSELQYGDWRFEPIRPVGDSCWTDTTAFIYALRVLGGAYIRFIWENDTTITAANGGVVDTVLANWFLRGKN